MKLGSVNGALESTEAILHDLNEGDYEEYTSLECGRKELHRQGGKRQVYYAQVGAVNGRPLRIEVYELDPPGAQPQEPVIVEERLEDLQQD